MKLYISPRPQLNHPPFASASYRFRLSDGLAELIDRWRYTRMVTLQFNDAKTGYLPVNGRSEAIRRALRGWDARINRHLLGRYWSSSPDRTFCFYVPEKISASPHWRGLVRFFTDDLEWRREQEWEFDQRAPAAWSEVVPQGTCVVSPVSDQISAREYLAKSLPYDVNYEHVVVPDEFLVR